MMKLKWREVGWMCKVMESCETEIQLKNFYNNICFKKLIKENDMFLGRKAVLLKEVFIKKIADIKQLKK